MWWVINACVYIKAGCNRLVWEATFAKPRTAATLSFWNQTSRARNRGTVHAHIVDIPCFTAFLDTNGDHNLKTENDVVLIKIWQQCQSASRAQKIIEVHGGHLQHTPPQQSHQYLCEPHTCIPQPVWTPPREHPETYERLMSPSCLDYLTAADKAHNHSLIFSNLY